MNHRRHCEQRSDAAIQAAPVNGHDGSPRRLRRLAMTNVFKIDSDAPS